ncbi:MAG: quinolinate synthase NadA, partial [Bdellovibrionales bacterium]|nr:quinolinate synthase NadA [Bdellovibrionales bacterium]
MADVASDILKLKKEKNAAILAHFYEDGEIQDIADVIGDSLHLAQQGQKLQNPVILLAGVVFMAESVKILSPDKTVLVPDLKAGCSLVTGSPAAQYRAWREKYPDHIAVTYVNSSAEVKAVSDVICTSSNAKKVIEAVPRDRQILFGPDRNLGRWLQKETGRSMKFWEGACEVHILFSAQRLFEMKRQNPNAVVLSHPECDDGILSQSDVIGSTSKILQTVLDSKPKSEFIVATEDGIFHQMRKARPDVKIIQAPTDANCACNQCPYMKLN